MIMFRRGARVRLDPRKCTQKDLKSYGSRGVIGEIYTVIKSSYMDRTYQLDGTNWHKEHWLTAVMDENIIGGKLNEKEKN